MSELNARQNQGTEEYPGHRTRGPLWLWVLVTIALLAAVGSLRLIVFPDRFVPLAAALTMVVCFLHRDLRLLWGMAAAMLAMIVLKATVLSPPGAEGMHFLFGAMQGVNVIFAAVVIHAVIRLTGRLEHTVNLLEQSNAELEASNEELAAREEEITQQNEELQSQTEELEQQTEELNAQTEELQMLNEQLGDRERALADLLQFSSGGAGEGETLGKLGATIEGLMGSRVSAAAVLERQGAEMVVQPLFGTLESDQCLPHEQTLADLAIRRHRAASLPDVSLRDDLVVPRLSSGSQVRSSAAAPLQVGDSVDGALEVYSVNAGEWTPHELRLVQWLADQCGRMMTTARLKDEREQLLRAEHQAREEAERANRAKDEFVATLSHELRTPLTAVLGWATLLRKSKCEDRDEAMKGLEVIERNARHQGQLISDLLDMSRILAGKISLDVDTVDLERVIEDSIESVRLAAEAKGVSLDREVEPMEARVVGDANRLQQVVWNLLSNAIKFTPRGGSVKVRVACPASFVEVAVIDTGEGIDPDVLPHLFERYRQADGSATRRHGGLGLGLAIVKNLIELHGGTVDARSDGRGKGSAFIVRLPIRATMPVGRRGADDFDTREAEIDDSMLEGAAVLVVDDEEDARELLLRILRLSGAEVHTAASAEEGLRVAKRVLPDVLVSDIGMPGTDGYDFIRTLRKQWPASKPQPPAIALTAFARSEERTRAFIAGFQAHLAKPVEAEELLATLGSLLYGLGQSREATVTAGSRSSAAPAG